MESSDHFKNGFSLDCEFFYLFQTCLSYHIKKIVKEPAKQVISLIDHTE